MARQLVQRGWPDVVDGSRPDASSSARPADSRGVKGFLGIRWSVGRKLGLAFGGVVCFLLGVSIVALHAIGSLARDHDRVDRTLPALLGDAGPARSPLDAQLPLDRQLDPPADRRSRRSPARCSRSASRCGSRLRCGCACGACSRASSTCATTTCAARRRARGGRQRRHDRRGAHLDAADPAHLQRRDRRGLARRQRDPRDDAHLARRLQPHARARRDDPREIAHSSASVAAASQQMATTSEETGRAVGEIATPSARSRRAPSARCARSRRRAS